MSDFQIFHGNQIPHAVKRWPPPPPWRRFDGKPLRRRSIPPEPKGDTFCADGSIIDLVNAAIHLRRPLLVTGKPGTGKSSLARAIARELKLGRTLVWPINSRSTRQEGLYQYDAIGRLQDASLAKQAARSKASASDIGKYLRLGPLGTALLPSTFPRVLLIDEIDKSDIDLPNDLLYIFEEGEFEIPELARDAAEIVHVRPATGDGEEPIPIRHGKVRCCEFPIVVLTSNGEREFPAAFNRRCIRVDMPEPDADALAAIVKAHFAGEPEMNAEAEQISASLVKAFLEHRKDAELATDQLLNLLRVRLGGAEVDESSLLRKVLLRPLSGPR
jgi:MoxR-like ATPase